MNRYIAALMAVASCASTAHPQTSPPAASIDPPPQTAGGGVLTLGRALALDRAASPAVDAANAGVRATDAARTVAGLRPNPTASVESENIAGTGPYRGFSQSETTVSLSLPIELGGKRSARVALAGTQGARSPRRRHRAGRSQVGHHPSVYQGGCRRTAGSDRRGAVRYRG